MSRSLRHLRRALIGVSCAIVFGFGATQAFGDPQLDTIPCDMNNPDDYLKCTNHCFARGLTGGGWCTVWGTCACEIPVDGWPVSAVEPEPV